MAAAGTGVIPYIGDWSDTDDGRIDRSVQTASEAR
jgi:hypothetical protein